MSHPTATALSLLLALTSARAEAPADLAGALEQAWGHASDQAIWRAAGAQERQVLQATLLDLAPVLDRCPATALAEASARLASVDLELIPLTIAPDRPPVLIIQEAREHRGAGLIALRCGPASDLVWQAPHAFFDLRTRDIARLIFAEGDARAVMWSTVHRYRATPGERPEDPVHPADVTREHGSLFQAATVALAAGRPELRFVQLHGFYASTMPWDAVISHGDREDRPAGLAEALEPVLGRVALYGRDVDDLGGTINVQGRILAAWPVPRFVHLELDPEHREALEDDPTMRADLARVLLEVPW